jgi:hypothetical protein
MGSIHKLCNDIVARILVPRSNSSQTISAKFNKRKIFKQTTSKTATEGESEAMIKLYAQIAAIFSIGDALFWCLICIRGLNRRPLCIVIKFSHDKVNTGPHSFITFPSFITAL